MDSIADLNGVGQKFENNGKWHQAIKNVSLSVLSGEILCLVGRSGSGKSTILNILSGTLTASEGQVKVKEAIAIVPQSDLLLPWRTVLENVTLPIEIKNELNSENIERAKGFLRLLGLDSNDHSFPHQLSGGMRQRVSIARALAQDVGLLLFDEPFSALDFDSRLKAGKELRALIKSNKKSAVFVTHNIEEAISLGDRIIAIGGSPASIQFESKVSIEDNFRDPVNVRKTPIFPELFEKIWRTLGGEK